MLVSSGRSMRCGQLNWLSPCTKRSTSHLSQHWPLSSSRNVHTHTLHTCTHTYTPHTHTHTHTTHTHTHFTHAHTNTPHIQAHTHTQVHTHAHTHTTCTHTGTHMHTLHTCTYTHARAHTRTHTSTHVHTPTYVYTPIPTSAAVLVTPICCFRGDFRSGKRLNIRRLIPYIASHYQNDRIWLRRNKPSKMDYQIMVAVDDSRSMAENKCKIVSQLSLRT